MGRASRAGCPELNRYERRRQLLKLLPLMLALLGLCSRFIGSAAADSGEAPLASDYREAEASISAGAYQQCAVTAVKGVKCWGYGPGGRLGDGTENTSATPVDVVGLDSEVSEVVAGDGSTCALTTSGGAKCWGGGVGDGSVNNYSLTAVDVLGMTSGVRQIAIGGGFTCFVTTASDVRCLGENGWAQLGDGTRTSTNTISSVVQGLGSNVRSIATMGQATCAIMLDTTVKCWGYAGFGQLGYGGYGIDADHPYVDAPVTVTGLSSVVALAAGDGFICALTSAGAVSCWGSNGDGQFGNGTATSSPTPVAIPSLQSGVLAITAGIASMCALLDTNEVKCSGRNSEAGLGLGYTGGPQYTPVALTGLSGTITAVTLGSYHGCALNSIGELRCWGSVAGLPGPVTSPTIVAGFDGVHTRVITAGAVVG